MLVALLASAVSALALDYGLPVAERPGFVRSPYAPNDGDIDVRGFAKDAKVKDPFSGKMFLVPEIDQLASPLPASQKAAEGFRFAKLNLADVSVQEALAFIGAEAKVRVHYEGLKEDSRRVTLRLSDVPASEAFYYAANAAGLKAVYKDDGVYFVSKAE